MKSISSALFTNANKLRTVGVKRHRWTPEELETILEQYRNWSQRAGPYKPFKLKDFILSLREHFPFFEELDDQHFYKRVQRTLYRVLAESGIAWRHYGKKRLAPEDVAPELKQTLEQLEENGVALATDGAVLLIFPMQAVSEDYGDEGYFVPTIPHAIAHLRRVITKMPDRYQHIKEQAEKVIPLLQQFLREWRQQKKREQIYHPEIKTLPSEEYQIEQDDEEEHIFRITKVGEGTTYVCDVEEMSCTCPAGQAMRMCKHLNYLLHQS